MIDELKYQREAIDGVVAATRARLAGSLEEPTVLLKAPTGSGKTVIAGLAIRELAADSELDLAFVWIAPYSLQAQAGRSLERIVGSRQRISNGEELGARPALDRGEIVFLNWASVNSASNLLRSGGEQRASLAEIAAGTRAAGRQLVLVIDESHHSSETRKAAEVVEEIAPVVTLEMSATPQVALGGRKHLVEVGRDEVCAEGLIRRSVLINPDLARFAHKDSEAGVLIVPNELLQGALDKLDELAALYRAEAIPVNPLLLIQIPDGKLGDEQLARLEGSLAARQITEENGRLAIWLDKRRTYDPTDGRILDKNGHVEVLIFKQAIATGWDCPRAQLLLKLRDPSKSAPFEVQTIGRIMRMPERRHYAREELNLGYVFHNHDAYKPAENMAVVTAEAHLRPGIAQQHDCAYVGRRSLTRITPEEAAAIAEVAIAALGFSGSDTAANRAHAEASGFLFDLGLTRGIEGDVVLDGEDAASVAGAGTNYDLQVSDRGLGRLFEQLVAGVLGPAENPGALRDELYDLLGEQLGFDRDRDVQAFVVNNRALFERALGEAVEQVSPMATRARRALSCFAWSLADTRRYNTAVGDESKHEQQAAALHAYEPCYLRVGRSAPERAFEAWLEGEGKAAVAWWAKNGETPGEDFSLVYLDAAGHSRNFFPDYLIGFHDGSFGVFETKSLEEAFLGDADKRETNERKLAALAAWVAAAPEGEHRDGGFVLRRGKGDLSCVRTDVPSASAPGQTLREALLRPHAQAPQTEG